MHFSINVSKSKRGAAQLFCRNSGYTLQQLEEELEPVVCITLTARGGKQKLFTAGLSKECHSILLQEKNLPLKVLAKLKYTGISTETVC